MPRLKIIDSIFYVGFFCVLSASAYASGADALGGSTDDWATEKVPQVWERTSGNPYKRNQEFSWYRCQITVPDSWKNRKLEIFIEGVDDAREAYWNGRLIASLGSLPPAYRSGLGAKSRYPIPTENTRFGSVNLLAIRVFTNDSRGGFNIAAPAVFAGTEAILLKGDWQARRGDDLAWSTITNSTETKTAPFSLVEDASEIERRLKLLAKDFGPLPLRESLAKLQHPADLNLELVLSEPEIHQPLSIKFDERGRLWVVEYLQYPNPAGLTRLSHDMHLRAVYDRVPRPPPNHFPGRDRITIHEDSNRDGKFDLHKTFLEDLSLVSSIAIGRGGVWVLNPPHLLFYPDRNHDDIPDGNPELHLEGFGLEDSHSVANSLRWGPDGWLYGAQGSTVTGNIRKPGSNVSGVRTLGQLIWRYHPEHGRYEVFAEGGGNTFGVEIDSKGRVYSGHNGGNTRGFHYVQGGYYQKGFGKHGALSNPYTFGYFNAMRHHQVPRFTHTFVIYEGAQLPKRYTGNLFGVEPLQGRIVVSEIQANGSSYQTRDLGHPLSSEDSWFRPVDIQAGPDGALYVADFYEQRIDHASHYQGRIHRESGRIYRLKKPNSKPPAKFDLSRLPTKDLTSYLHHSNKWFRQTAIRILGDRMDRASVPAFRTLLNHETGQGALEALWAINASGGLSEAVILEGLAHRDPHVRAWSIRIACDDFEVSEPIAHQLALMSRSEPNVQVRSQLASSARRISGHLALTLVENLLTHQEDIADVHIPLLLWWTVESKADTDRVTILNMVRKREVWNSPLFQKHIAGRLMRRFAAGGSRKDLLDCAELFRLAEGDELENELLSGLEAAYQGRLMTGLPDELSDAISKFQENSLLQQLRQGDPAAVESALEVLADETTENLKLIQILDTLSQLRVPEAVPALLNFVRQSANDTARRAALASLAVYENREIGSAILQLHNTFPPSVRDAAQVLLSNRLSWANEFLHAIQLDRINPQSVSPAVIRKLVLFEDLRVRAQVNELWPELDKVPTEKMAKEIERIDHIAKVSLGNPYNGKALYHNLCGACHTLFAKGGQIGPDLTSYQRTDSIGLLMNIVNPSAEIREGYEQFVITTKDQRTINGFLNDQDSSIVILRGLDGQNTAIPRSEIESMKAVEMSLMPEGLLSSLSDEQIRDLFAYLRSGQPLPN